VRRRQIAADTLSGSSMGVSRAMLVRLLAKEANEEAGERIVGGVVIESMLGSCRLLISGTWSSGRSEIELKDVVLSKHSPASSSTVALVIVTDSESARA
jgi:hypothetical protein